jgi:hypothetical protein
MVPMTCDDDTSEAGVRHDGHRGRDRLIECTVTVILGHVQVSAEIKTQETGARLIFLLSPIMQTIKEAARER